MGNYIIAKLAENSPFIIAKALATRKGNCSGFTVLSWGVA